MAAADVSKRAATSVVQRDVQTTLVGAAWTASRRTETGALEITADTCALDADQRWSLSVIQSLTTACVGIADSALTYAELILRAKARPQPRSGEDERA
jgi:hypothetical protein